MSKKVVLAIEDLTELLEKGKTKVKGAFVTMHPDVDLADVDELLDAVKKLKDDIEQEMDEEEEEEEEDEESDALEEEDEDDDVEDEDLVEDDDEDAEIEDDDGEE